MHCTTGSSATTVYVTHDQLEAMAMADTIAIMNQGVIEQLGAPQEVYDRPASVFVADFIGAPAMNLLALDASGDAAWRRGACAWAMPCIAGAHACTRMQASAPGAGCSACGPSTCSWPTHSPLLRGEVFGTEYLGTSADRHAARRRTA